MKRTLLRDRDWASIDGRLCLVRGFAEWAKMENDEVVAMNPTTPYGSVDLTCEDSTEEITGFITHKTDFAMLWAAFHRRTRVAGTRLEFGSLSNEINPDGLGENEEVLLVWTQTQYRALARLFGKGWWPRLIVMVCPKGAFGLILDRTGQIRPDITGLARARASLPLVTWRPEVMK